MDNKSIEKVIYLETNDDVASVIEKIQNEPETDIILVVPKRSTLTRSVINFKILKDEADILKKKICIITGDKLGQNLAKQAGLSIREEEFKQEANLSVKGKKNEPYSISDLRNLASEEEVLEIKRGIMKELNTEEASSPSPEIHHVQVSDIIRKSQTTEVGHDQILEKIRQEPAEEKLSSSPSIEMDIKKVDSERETVVSRPAAIVKPKYLKEEIKTVSVVSSSTKKIFLVFAVSCLVIALAVGFIVLPKANVSIVPKVEPLVANVDTVVDPEITAVDASVQKIPGKIITVTREKIQDFTATGKKKLADKAQGVITISNEWSTSPQVLVENTRFLSKDGKIFRTKKTVVIPGMQRVEGQDVPGTIDANVEAQEAGEAYNIDPTSFTIPGFLGTVKYETIYGRSQDKMSGGSTADVQVVTSADITSARDAIIKAVGDEITAQIKQETPKDFKIMNEAIQTKIDEFQTDANPDDVKDKFTAKVKATSTALVFDEKDIKTLVGEIIKSKITNDKILVSQGSDVTTYGTPSFDKSGKMLVSVHIEKKVMWKIDTNALKEKMKGKNQGELNGIFSNTQGVDYAKVWFWPFWVNTVPGSDTQVDISTFSIQ